MYPMLNTWISDPTPVTISAISIESWSSCSATSSWRLPTGIQDQYGRITASCRSAPSMRTKFRTAKTKARARTPGPTSVGISLRSGARNAVAPLTAKPRSGRRTIAQGRIGSNVTLPPQQVEVLDVDRLGVAEDRDDDREPDRRFRGSHGHHEEDEDLSLDPDRARERNEREVHGVEHELDAHEQDDRVAADHHAEDADREQDRRKDERFREHRSHPPFRQQDRPHDRDQEQERRELERHQVAAEHGQRHG